MKKRVVFNLGETMECKNKKALLEVLQLLSLWRLFDEYEFDCFENCDADYCVDTILDIIHQEIHSTLDDLLTNNEA